MTEITFLGGASEVGRTGILIDNNGERFLLDYGVNVETMDVPVQPDMPIKALLLSHAHLDHSGNIPALYRQGWNGRVYATPATFDIANILLKDSLKVQKLKGIQPRYTSSDVTTMDRRGMNMRFNKPKDFKSTTVSFHDAGHVPGSASILMDTRDKRILYTGDIKFEETMLMKSAYREFHNIDVLITESTYSYKNHPPRHEAAKKMRSIIEQTIQNGGHVILPCFAVGRTQEILLIVSELGFPVYLDGMGISATRAALMHPESVKNQKRLKEAFGRAYKVRSHKHRKDAVKKSSIIITTAGMLSGGPVHFYIKKFHDKPECTMILNGFQIPGTVGRTLLDTGRYIYEDTDIKPKMRIEFMDMSAHCGRNGIINFIKHLNPEKTLLVHGERTGEFAKELKEMGFDTTAPRNREKIKV